MSKTLIYTILLVIAFIVKIQSAPAGWCYQCNSNNPLCGNQVDPSQRNQMTPCNGQCYTYSYKNVLYRGCSWEHGFMAHELTSEPVYAKNNVWLFCDTPFCNNNADQLKSEICDSDICSFLPFPAACGYENIDTQCGRVCGNPMCLSK